MRFVHRMTVEYFLVFYFKINLRSVFCRTHWVLWSKLVSERPRRGRCWPEPLDQCWVSNSIRMTDFIPVWPRIQVVRKAKVAVTLVALPHRVAKKKLVLVTNNEFFFFFFFFFLAIHWWVQESEPNSLQSIPQMKPSQLSWDTYPRFNRPCWYFHAKTQFLSTRFIS